jgi:23S rRNA-/tRNA-specific pseudouridylate synthase
LKSSFQRDAPPVCASRSFALRVFAMIAAVRPVLHFSVLSSTPLRALVDEALLRLGAVYVSGRRSTEATIAERGALVRVHVRPRRFRGLSEPRLIEQTSDYVLVDKPAGLPVHPTCDNAVENLLVAVEERLGEKLFVCHRLDVGTSGLCLFARNLEFRRAFARALETRQVQKRYEAIVHRPVAPGTYRHWQRRRARAPYLVEGSPSADARECVLHVLACRPEGGRFVVDVAPVTGRQHQIRAQLAFLGAPIEGDTLYGAPSSLPCHGDGEVIGLRATALAFPGRS